jgi:hypothetical protein
MHRRALVTGCAGLLGAIGWGATVAAGADLEPQAAPSAEQQIIESLYGERIRAARATIASDDDLALAGNLADAAESQGIAPTLITALYETAFELAAPWPEGFELASSAMMNVAERAPDRRVHAYGKLADLHYGNFRRLSMAGRGERAGACLAALLRAADLRMASGDFAGAQEVYTRAQSVAMLVDRRAAADLRDAAQQARRMAGYRRQLDAAIEAHADDPSPESARRIVDLCVITLNRPQLAVDYAPATQDAALVKRVKAATRPIDRPDAAQLLDLGEWYRKLALAAGAEAQLPLLARAKIYYEHFLAKADPTDQGRVRAKLAQRQVDMLIDQRGGLDDRALSDLRQLAANTKVDVLKLIDPRRHRARGTAEMKDGALMQSYPRADGAYTARGIAAAPIAPKGSYEIRATYVRTGVGSAAFLLPIADRRLTVEIDESKVVLASLHSIDGEVKRYRGTSEVAGDKRKGVEPFSAVIGVDHRGESVTLRLDVDGERIIDWSGKAQQITQDLNWPAPNARALGLGARYATITWRQVELKMTRGLATRMPTLDLKSTD